MRIEHDLLEELAIPPKAYWGIHTQRALKNFAVPRSTGPSHTNPSLRSGKGSLYLGQPGAGLSQ